jgi:hypothetical protein
MRVFSLLAGVLGMHAHAHAHAHAHVGGIGAGGEGGGFPSLAQAVAGYGTWPVTTRNVTVCGT